MIPRATLRLQFRREFTLNDAKNHVDRFASLGISHVYASPLQQARPGSTHGYDTIDYRLISPELGGEEALREFVVALRARNMGLILDIVPNHMATSYDNPWWRHVLEGGANSRYANYFDIDWQSPDPVLRDKVVAPFLARPYGECLSDGSLRLSVDEESGNFFVEHHGNRFPLALRDYAVVLDACKDASCTRLAAMFRDIGNNPLDYRHAEAARRAIAIEIANGTGAGIRTALEQFSCDTPEGMARLHRMLERQHYRLAWWRSGIEEINWRRFFEVSDLIGMRVERKEVFEDQHALIFRLYAEGLIDGVRIDHVDGLAHPRTYCNNLRERLEALSAQRQALGLSTSPYIVVEKILAEDEQVPDDWQVAGTTGYDFMDDVSAVLHDENGAEPLEKLWRKIAGAGESYAAELRAARHQLLTEHFAAEFDTATRALHRIARSYIATRDVSLASIRRALHALLMYFPVYRLYGDERGRHEHDLRLMELSLAGASEALRPGDRQTLRLIDRWLGGEAIADSEKSPIETEREAERHLLALTRFQQLTPPLAAKSLEDTIFYRYGRLLSRNEVGSNPSRLARSVDEFHTLCLRRQSHSPHALLATASHDHKRGEDARVRLATLSEIPDDWQSAVESWFAMNNMPARQRPMPGEEYMLYQMLVGAWPLDLRPDDREGLLAFAERIAAWQQKSMREAKLHSSWTAPDEAYEARCRAFLWRVFGLYEGDSPGAFPRSLAQFVRRVERHGIINSLSQAVLRMTCPGVPDLYQGTDAWDFSLVDPDNRRLVDHGAAERALRDNPPSQIELLALLQAWRDGRIKRQVIASALQLRARNPELFAEGDYQPLQAQGPLAGHVIAFTRHVEDRWLITICVRHSARLALDDDLPRPERDLWNETTLPLPQALHKASLVDAFSQRRIECDTSILLDEALAVLPVAMLTSGNAAFYNR